MVLFEQGTKLATRSDRFIDLLIYELIFMYVIVQFGYGELYDITVTLFSNFFHVHTLLSSLILYITCPRNSVVLQKS